MPGNVRVLGPAEVTAGFALAGLRTVTADTIEEERDRMAELLAEPDVAVVLVEEGCYGRLPEDVRRHISRRPLPMVVPFPGPAWQAPAGAADAYIVDLLRQVIGYRVRLK